MRRYTIVLFLISGFLFMGCQVDDADIRGVQGSPQGTLSINQKEYIEEIFKPEKFIEGVDEETGLHIVDNPDSIEVYVNKQRMLPHGYEPSDLVEPAVSHSSPEGFPQRLMRQEAAEALEALFAHAESEGLELVAISGYRSFERQEELYNHYVETHGQERADQYSARPGTSEHQTGLAMDISAVSVSLGLVRTFEQTEEGSWLAEHAHLHGFILRYPEGQTDITGYAYEPWHYRYVGEELATEIYQQDLTLEEYFGFDY